MIQERTGGRMTWWGPGVREAAVDPVKLPRRLTIDSTFSSFYSAMHPRL